MSGLKPQRKSRDSNPQTLGSVHCFQNSFLIQPVDFQALSEFRIHLKHPVEESNLVPLFRRQSCVHHTHRIYCRHDSAGWVGFEPTIARLTAECLGRLATNPGLFPHWIKIGEKDSNLHKLLQRQLA